VNHDVRLPIVLTYINKIILLWSTYNFNNISAIYDIIRLYVSIFHINIK